MRQHKPDHRQKPDEFNNIAMNNTRTKRPQLQKGGPAQSAESAGPHRRPANQRLALAEGSAAVKLTPVPEERHSRSSNGPGLGV